MPAPALARISADATLTYTNFDAQNNKNGHISGNTLTQQYSLLYSTSGTLMDKRIGGYTLSLGYDWAAINSSVSSTQQPYKESYSINGGHIIYNGEIFIDPKEMPFKFKAYSRDLSRTSIIHETRTLSGTSTSLLYDVLTTSLNKGTHITSGATLIFGVKNGMTNGYNEVFRHIPMIFIDYKDEINKNLSSASPTNNRLSKLAFVSLNKKDNWFHYRFIRYDDFIVRSNEYTETHLQLGTVDHLMERKWIDFSNWLQVSIDGLHVRKSTRDKTDDYDDFSLNAFLRMRRMTWQAHALASFERTNELSKNGLITYRTNLPIYADGVISPASRWNASTSFSDNHTTRGDKFQNINSAFQIELYRTSPFTLTNRISNEYAANGNGVTLQNISAHIATASTRKYSTSLSLNASYDIRHNINTSSFNEQTLTDQQIAGSLNYAVSNNISLYFSQVNRFVSGNSSYVTSNIPGTGVNTPQYVDPRDGSAIGSSSYQSISSITASWRPTPSLDTSLSIQNDYYSKQSSNPDNLVRINSIINYRTQQLTITSNNTYSKSTTSKSPVYNQPNQLKTEDTVQYSISRNFQTLARLIYFKYLDSADRSERFEFDESMTYSYYTYKGLPRKIWELTQSFKSTKDINLNQPFSNKLSLSGSYFPIRQITLSAGMMYNFTDTFSDYTISYNASAAMSYRLLSASLDYSYGRTKLDGRIEKRFGASFRKSF